jgi:crotonobetainyl-CoA:carnitine CoA-transferase CaiB-like acyl-CoA transferase
MPGPLAGIRVLDLTSVVSGPLATMFLADQGADVIKIEPLGGDITRRSQQSTSASGEFSALFVSTNRGKRSLSLDLAINATERIVLMAEIIKERPTAEWLQRLDINDVPSAPVLGRGQVIANEQVLARELIAEFDHPDIGSVRQPKPAARFDCTPAEIRGPAPRIGEHSAILLAELGLEAAEIERLAAEKIVHLVKI